MKCSYCDGEMVETSESVKSEPDPNCHVCGGFGEQVLSDGTFYSDCICMHDESKKVKILRCNECGLSAEESKEMMK